MVAGLVGWASVIEYNQMLKSIILNMGHWATCLPIGGTLKVVKSFFVRVIISVVPAFALTFVLTSTAIRLAIGTKANTTQIK